MASHLQKSGSFKGGVGSGNRKNGRWVRMLRCRLMVDVVRTMAPAVVGFMGLGVVAVVAPAAHAAIPSLNLGDSVFNPVTNSMETVSQIAGPASVITNTGYVILLAQTVGDVFALSDGTVTVQFEVTAVSTTDIGGTSYVTGVTLKNLSDNSVQSVAVSQPVAGDGASGTGSTSISFPPPTGSSNTIYDVRKGGNGGDGRDGAIFVPASSGGAGATGPTITRTISGPLSITAVPNSPAGIYVASIGGDGGDGGSSYLNLAGGGKNGGAAGAGGTVNLTVGSSVTINTSGSRVYGIFAQSAAGSGGDGGSGYATTGGGGSGGSASQGGAVTLNSEATVNTTGNDAIGILAQSVGGNGGTGGSSYVSITSAGGGSYGGNGGSVAVTQGGTVQTSGSNAHGVLAQSIGGTGGNAGTSGGTILSLGNNGGAGGSGGNVSLTATGSSITRTSGAFSVGLFAQSVGGGGGNGGTGVAIASFGSSGGSGGSGGSASIALQEGAYVQTLGRSSDGVFAQSIGGGGGTGGVSVGLVSLGTSGTGGGSASNVSITSAGTIETAGADSRGLFAQSVGGGGGSAGGSVGLVSLGSSGGTGGSAGNVTVNQQSAGSVHTSGAGSTGIFAQSIGGGGGSGGYSIGLAGLGGSGDAGGSGGLVSVSNAGRITTEGASAKGIFAQSVGGGGGSGGAAGSLFVSIGGRGSGGGTGGAVNVTQSGSILTEGSDAIGIQAQSIGGGGGSGGGAITVGTFAGVAIGGSGSGGGAGGNVTLNFQQATISGPGGTITVDPTISTTGDRAHGVLAQSVGGGGGNGGFATAIGVSVSAGGSFAIGGSGATGGAGGTVNLDGDVSVTTEGNSAQGVIAQSVGGGGGDGGLAVAVQLTSGASFSLGIGGSGGAGGTGGTVSATTGGFIETGGDFSTGFTAQSVGGGGGNGGMAVSVAGSAGLGTVSVAAGFGGQGGNGGAGGVVRGDFIGSIITAGDNAGGAVVQSLGGGGGTGGFNISAAMDASLFGGVSAAVGFGGTGGSGGAGGTVAGSIGSVATTGDRSVGVTIQSVGGGGGAGGFNVAGAVNATAGTGGSAAIGFGGAGGGGGAGGSVNGTVNGTISTDGAQSSGITIQSVGGGGGAGGFSVAGALSAGASGALSAAVGFGGSGGGGGSASNATGTITGLVTTLGAQSTGAIVQSVGGGGGAGGFSIAGGLGASGGGAGAVAVGFGASGATGGDGAAATMTRSGDTGTWGVGSAGLIVQSLGGGGGAGGFSVGGALAGAGGGSGAVGVGLGGFGGGGGNSAQAQLTLVGNTATLASLSDAITVQSLGGGGGAGGFTVGGALSGAGFGSGAVGVGVGGLGGSGGFAGQALATITGNVGTTGDLSRGVLVQSAGGGGGSGGFSVAGAISGAGKGSGAVGVGVGGFGGDGGAAARAQLTLAGDTYVQGRLSDAITVQSLGGGGGAGGFSAAGGFSGAGVGSGTVGVGIGGFGGAGGTAAEAIATINGNVGSAGDLSRGVLVQSAGGGGGSGGFSIGGSLSGAGAGSGAVGAGIGGFGGDGGASGQARLTLTGDTITLGTLSDAITVQSLGGGGGAGGFSVAGAFSGAGTGGGTVGVGIGGFGGAGGTAAEASATILGNIGAGGDLSHGVLVQSAGGGGGSGGFSIGGSLSGAGTGSGAVGVGVGGFGGDGGASGQARLTLTGDTITLGTLSDAIVVQSLGGGGGAGGFSVAGALSGAGTGSGAVGAGVGGFGGSGGNASSATAMVTGDVGTDGDLSRGVLVQSVGGGGGAGGFAVGAALSGSGSGSGAVGVGLGGFGGGGGAGADASLTFAGDVLTSGVFSDAITVQSVGGGGGAGGFSVAGALSGAGTGSGTVGVGIGGFGGDGGNAGNVVASVTGSSSTTGNYSTGIQAQSIGGGGGSGGFTVAGSASFAGNGAGAVALGMGGFGGAGGNAGTVVLTRTGDTGTSGTGSSAILAQSLGGGGGNGGFSVAGSVAGASKGGGALSLGLGGFGGGGGSGSAVTADVSGLVQTTGQDSSGVLAQSLGGGGGNGGMSIAGSVGLSADLAGAISIGVGGFGGGGGNAGNVSLTRTGNTLTSLGGSDGIAAQSLGGGGGNGGLNVSGSLAVSTKNGGAVSLGLGGFGGDGGDAGNVSLSLVGNVLTGAGEITSSRGEGLPGFALGSGIGGNALVAQSIGGGGGNGGLNVSAGIALTNPSGGDSFSAAIGVGGFGGGGGNAGSVIAGSAGMDGTQGLLVANGDGNAAFLAQSIGGSGGSGGINVSGGISMDGNLTLGIGGFGGAGGTASTVSATVRSAVYAAGSGSAGVVAQSLGGGGGVGGINVSGGLTLTKEAALPSLTLGIGGFGGAGNVSGNVSVDQVGRIGVEGGSTVGILAQSIGGGGGMGGINVSAAGTTSQQKTGLALAVGVGGNGGTGADAGSVSVSSRGLIEVNRNTPAELLNPPADLPSAVESVLAKLGLKSLEGPSSATAGILAQSIGGGGGIGGLNGTLAVAPFGSTAAIGIGGSGGAAGDASTVTVVRGFAPDGLGGETAMPATILTRGDNASGLVAQSIGGGGGMAGMTLGFALSGVSSPPEGDKNLAANIVVGGSGGASGAGDDVTVRHAGDILTEGDRSDAITAQSIGGGGGSANYSLGLGLFNKANALSLAVGGDPADGSEAGDVVVSHSGLLWTEGKDSVGIRAQSIGGGGGDTKTTMALGLLASNSMSITIGRSGGAGGQAGNVGVSAAGSIYTFGQGASAILAQSIGGGGGTSSTTSVGVSGSQESSGSHGFSMAVGLEGGTGATSGDVTVGNQATILTLGANARGILAQSIGGGGGVGGSATAIAFRSATQIGLSLGGAGGTGAASGNVGVDNGARITTVGDDAEAVLAQSIGGGGGIGGMVNVIGLQIGGVKSGTDQTTVNLAVGGTGGTGAVAGGVTANNSGRIITVGERSYGIRAESIGGGGGSGGAVINARLQGSGQSTGVDINIGGTGGTGAAAGAVNVTNSGRVETLGTEAAGIVATSVGGGGGSGGLVLDMLFGTSGGEKTQQFKLNVGGSGGTGGTGGDVSVVNGATGSIQTWGDKAYGILAQSIGGGGGRGSSVISATGMAASEQSMILGLSLGGVGGSGNNAGDVNVSNAGTITTSGDDAHGIFAQSIGGGGGTGGMALAGVISGSAAKSTHTFAIGGIGGTGADAGAVTVTNTGSIVTYGARSDGIRAQSIGGGGGDANVGLMLGTSVSGIGGNLFNGLLGAIGGGAGGAGGPVTVNQSGSITVYGANAQAISAASINGGGGSLTFDLSGITDLVGTPLDPAGELRSTIMAVLGGENTSDANSTAVTINAVGNQAVVGAGGSGTGVQSVGGGGGTAYLNLNFVPTSQSTTLRSRSTLQSTMAIAPTVAVAPAAMAAAVPAAAPVLLSDVVIGLGGTGGNGNGGAPITVSLDGEILTAGTDTPGQLHQTIGGGGGRAVAALDVSAAAPGAVIATLGATDTVNSSGGTINAVQTGRVITSGDIAPGAMLQSIGGGGGTVGVYLSAGSPVGPIADLTLGADGGSGLDGGAITASYSGGISTTGDLSAGLLVQSIGAGGGNVRLSQIGANTIVIGGANGATGSGGSIEIFNNGQIATFGARSHAVMLQSIGGGGGAVFGTDLGGVVSRSGAIGDGGAISFAQTGDIVADGEGSRGVIAQSIGGGGGYVEGLFAGSAGGQGSGGSIDLTLGGSVLATALDGTAVFAQSVGDAGGNITIGVTGDVRGGSGAGAGIHLDGGANNFVLSSGSLSAVSQLAALGTTGNDTVENTGRLYGNVMLGSGNNQLLNRAGATFMAASDIQLRTDPSATGLFQNDGLLLMGLSAAQRPIDLAAGDEFPNADGLFDPRQNLFFGSRVVTQTDLAGDLVQTETGHMVYDVAFGPYASDKIRASGDVTVDGTMDVTLTWLENSQSYVMVSTETGATVTDLGLQVTDTLAMDYRVQATSRGIELDFTSHFDQPYLTPNGRAIGKHMNSAIEAGGSGGIGRLSAWMGNLVAGQEQLYGHLMTQVSPEAYLTGIKLHYLGADRFRRQLAEASTSATEGWSWWGSLDLDDFDQKSKVDQYGAKSTGFLTTIGGRGEIGSNLFLSASLGYRRIDSFAVTDGTFTAGAGDAFHMGGMLAWRPESGVELTGSVTAGWQWLHSMRLTDIFEPITAHAKPKASDLQFTMGASYTHRFGAGFFKPAFDLTGTALHQSEFAESGLSGLGMKADSRTQWLWAANPRIVAGVTLQDRGPNRAEVRFKVGGVFQLEDTLAMPYRFIGANPGADPALLTLGLNRNSLMLGGEFVLSHHDRMTFTAGLSHLGGNRDNSLTGSARLTIKF